MSRLWFAPLVPLSLVACDMVIPTPSVNVITTDAGTQRDATAASTAGLESDGSVTADAAAVDAGDDSDAAPSPSSSSTPPAPSPSGPDPLPKGVGWHRLPGTSLMGSGACAPDVGQMANEGCSAVINDWNGAAYDSTHRRLVFAGGGHSGYFGNEVYALQLDVGPSGKTVRLNDPTPNPTSSVPWGGNPCQNPTTYYDGRPNSVHNYGSLVYVPGRDVLFQQAGAPAPCGYATTLAWTLNLANLPSLAYPGATQWTRIATQGPLPGAQFAANGDGQSSAAYDPVSGRVFVHSQYELMSYDFATNQFTKLSDINTDANANVGLGVMLAIDPKRRRLVAIGRGQLKVVDIAPGSTHKHENWSVDSACAPWVNAEAPGVEYDPVADRIVGVTGRSNEFFALDMNAMSCTARTFGGDSVPVPQYNNGTYGRFRYADYLDGFVLINDPNKDALILRTR